MAARRSPSEIAEALEARAAQLKADADRRRAVATDAICNWLWEAECALHRVRLATTDQALSVACGNRADSIRLWREARWATLKKELDTP